MDTLDRVLDYLVKTSELGLVLGGLVGLKLYATVDASYGAHDDRKLHSGCALHTYWSRYWGISVMNQEVECDH